MLNRIIPLVICTIVGAAVAGVLVIQSSNQKQQAALDEQKQAFRKEAQQSKGVRDKTTSKHALELEDRAKALEQSRAREAQLEGRLDAVLNAESPEVRVIPFPEAIIEALQAMDQTDKRAKRLAVFHLESLVQWGDGALPAITAFMEKGIDMEFKPSRSERDKLREQGKEKVKKGESKPKDSGKKKPSKDGKSRTGMAWNYFRPFPRPEGAIPATLRLGLLETTAYIGSEKAEKLLLDVLGTTGRGVEIAYLEMLLQDMAPGKHLKTILKITREILANLPPLSDDAMSVDRETKGYLYAILVKYKDRVFVETAKTLLVTPDGKLDGYVLSYLRRVLGADAIPILQAVIQEDRLEDGVARYAIRDAALYYVGQSAQADRLLMDTFREGMARQEEGGDFNWGPFKVTFTAITRDLNGQSNEVLANRRQLLQNAREEFNHPTLNQGLDKMDGQLQRTLERETNPNK
jgi:hypothetical protein|tara:strand:+ start:293 stop:1681 length:1389 start_codon:yes stop_codon:yes gene_type:complete